MKALKPWLVIILVFAAGVAGGVVATRATVRHYIQEAVSKPDTVRNLMEQRLVRRLQLKPEQRRQTHQILVKRQTELRDLRAEFASRFLQAVSNANSEISATLTPQQREEFEKIKEQNRRLQQLLKARAAQSAE